MEISISGIVFILLGLSNIWFNNIPNVVVTSFLAFTLAVGLLSFLTYHIVQAFNLLKYILLSDIEKYKVGAWAILLSIGVASIEIILGIGKLTLSV